MFPEAKRCSDNYPKVRSKDDRHEHRITLDLAGFEPIPDPAEPELDQSTCSVMMMWPEASQSMLCRDFKGAARGYREAYEKSRGWHEDDSVPFTTNQLALLELILQAEVWEMNEPH